MIVALILWIRLGEKGTKGSLQSDQSRLGERPHFSARRFALVAGFENPREILETEAACERATNQQNAVQRASGILTVAVS